MAPEAVPLGTTEFGRSYGHQRICRRMAINSTRAYRSMEQGVHVELETGLSAALEGKKICHWCQMQFILLATDRAGGVLYVAGGQNTGEADPLAPPEVLPLLG
jgi:hypothetical protein